MDAAVASRRLLALHSHLQGVNGHECDASGIAMQDCAASSAVAFARPVACNSQHARVGMARWRRWSMEQGDRRHEEAALRTAEHVLGGSMIPVHAPAAAKAPPACAKASGDDARMLQAVAEAHAAFECSLRSTKPQAAQKLQEAPRAAFSHTAKRGLGLRADALQSSTSHILQVALPGVRADDLRVEVNGRQLTISGRRPVLSVIPVHGRAAAPAAHHNEHGLALKPRYGPFTSMWRLPADADTRRASAELENGVLRVRFRRNF